MKEYFSVNVSRYVSGKNFTVARPASLNHPKDNAVMFISEAFMGRASAFDAVSNCLVFWPRSVPVPESLQNKHAVVICDSPHTEYCRFYRDNGIVYLPPAEEYDVIGGAYIAKNARIGEGATILPGAYIGGEVVLGDDVYIGAGAKLMGEVIVGDHVVIRENTVIGADSLTTDREKDGTAVTMPQFGKVVIEDNVQIGANAVIARGAIDETRICKGAKISGSCYVSHNVRIGEDTFIAGETILLGSSSVGRNCLISGNCTVNNYTRIGDYSVLGMGSVAARSIPDHVVAYGNPAKAVRSK